MKKIDKSNITGLNKEKKELLRKFMGSSSYPIDLNKVREWWKMMSNEFTLSEEDIKKILSTPVIEISESNVSNDIHLSKEDRIKQAKEILKQRSKLDDDYETSSGIIAVPPPKGVPRYNLTKMFEYCDKNNKNAKELSVEERKRFEIVKED
ncbi:hypothetical protein [Priestia flexa]|uniref:hypothetical protein n=1 Tax=Priestia flexa TaxID=86664 RepID=UPI000473A221|nr:hypothetical protein [Priestia flexa]